MAGIYIHIPFCRKACHYCNFHFSTSTALMPEFMEALLTEMMLHKNYLTEIVSTIYIGGGTPSLLSKKDLSAIFDGLYRHFKINDSPEITLEANPDDITGDKLAYWKSAGVNRLSIGVQSFDNIDLAWMNRAHNATQATEALSLALQYGFNVTIDLIYGTPLLTDEQWKVNVQTAIDYGVPHLSCYALTVEAGTALENMITRKKMEGIDTEKQARHFELLSQWTHEAGYEQYEISNFAKPGFESKHNSSYWQGKPYLGIGPSAHSFNGLSRQWNIANNALYIKSILNRHIPAEIEILTPQQQLNEYIMTSLRTADGISLQIIEQKWGLQQADRIITGAQKYLFQHARVNNRHLQLTAKGKLLADGIAAELFL